MAKNRKNNHYHYAEKFDDRRRRQRKLFMPKKTAVVAALFLLIFGIVTTTFSAYVSDNIHPETGGHSILVNVRNAKAEKDIAFTGAEADLAALGYDVTSGALIYFDATGWNLSSYPKVQIMVGHGSYSSCYDMTNVSGNLYYISMPSWGGFTQLCFIANASSWASEGNSPDHRNSYASQYTNIWTADRGLGTSKKYLFRKASADGDAALTFVESSNDLGTFLNSTFKIYSATKTGSGGYSNSAAGGTATIAGTKKTTNSNTSTTTFSSTTSTSTNPATNYPLWGTAVTMSTGYTTGNANADNNANKGYKFDGYTFDAYVGSNGASTAGSPINMTSIGGETTTVYACFSEVLHNVTIKTNIPGDTSTTTNTCVGVVTTKSLSAPIKTGYTFTGWSSFPSGVTATSGSTSTSNITIKYANTATSAQTVTLTANYSINPPTAVSIDDKTTTVGTSVSLNPSVTIAASGATADNTYAISPSSGASITSAGVFTATKPGVYNVTLSSKATKAASGGVAALTSTTSTDDTAIVTVKPVKPTWTLTMSGFDSTGDLNNGHTYGFDALNPYLVNLGSSFSFTASIYNPPNDNNYVYTWYNSDDEVLGTGSTLTFGQDTADEATLADVSVPVYCKVTYTGTDASTIFATGDTITVYYYIKSPIKSFGISDLQKIYNTDNDAKMKIEYNIPNATGYTTELYASSDGVKYYSAVTATGFLGTQIGATAVYELDPSDNDGPMSTNGPKYFYVNMSKTGASGKTDIVHTTVGADSAEGTRQIYFINNTGLDLTNNRVMAFFTDSNGDTYYQAAQDVYKGISGKPENTRFRVTVPADTTQISFGIARASRYGVAPWTNDNFDYTLGNNESGKDNVYYIAYTPSLTTLDDTHNTISATGKTLVSGYTDDGTDPNPFYTLTTTYLSYQSAD